MYVYIYIYIYTYVYMCMSINIHTFFMDKLKQSLVYLDAVIEREMASGMCVCVCT